MAVSFSFFPKAITTLLLACSITLICGGNWPRTGTANAQNLIERALSGNTKKTTPQKRTKKKRSIKQQRSKPQSAPVTVIPVPTPAPEREAVAPRREKEPAQSAEQAKSNVETPRPEKNERIYQVACPALMQGDVEGKLSPPINDGPQCSAQSPLSLTAIGKAQPLKFANPVTTNCAMAVTLAKWSEHVREAASKVYGNDVKVTEVGTGSDYQCRNVNGASEGRVSEHAFANALDIMSFKFSDGSVTELKSGWNGSEKEKAFWRAVHDASCKLFMTVIGPEGDAAHITNMHLDQGCHGKTCLARICQ